jgi:hypothetical protein
MMAVNAQKPNARRQKIVSNAKEYLAEVRKMLIAGVVLQIGVGHERRNTIKDRTRKKHPSSEIIEGHHRLKRKDDQPPGKQDGIEDQQRCGVLLPIHRPALQASFAPAKKWQRTVFPIHDPGDIFAHRNRDEQRDDNNRKG